MMILLVARKEWRDMMRDGRFRVGSSLIALVLLASLVLGAAHQNSLRVERDTARKVSHTQWVTQSDKDPHNATHDGLYVVKAPSPLEFFDPGVSRYTGSAVFIKSHQRSEATLRGARDEGVAGRFGALSAALVLQLLMPLLIVLLGFGVFAGERESGTLRQVLATGVSRNALLWGKLLGLGAVLSALLVPATLAGVVALRLASGQLPLEASRVLLLVLVYGAYFAVFAAITMAVSARARTARGALATLLGFWAFTVLLAPRLASDVGRALYPAPSTTEWTAWVDEAKKSHESNEKPIVRVKRVQARLMKQYGVKTLQELPVNYVGVLLQESEDGTNRAFDHVYARLSSIYKRQHALFDAVSLVAPALSVRSLSMALSGTDWRAYQNFSNDVESYRRDWVRRLNADLAAHPTRPRETYEAGHELWESMPTFEPQPLTLGAALKSQMPSLTTLGLWLALALGAMAWAVRGMRL